MLRLGEKWKLLTLVTLAAGLLAIGCGEDELAEYRSDTSGALMTPEGAPYSITEFEEFGESAMLQEDGTVEMVGTALVSIDGKGAHEVEVFVSVEPLASGARRTMITQDLETGEERVFHYDQEDNAVVIGDLDGGVFVFNNPDGTYDVVTGLFDAPASEDEYRHAEDSYEAWRLVMEYNQFAENSPHSLLMAVAMSSGPSLSARTSWPCEVPNCPESCQEAAEGPILCDVFDRLCTCTICFTTGADWEECGGCAL